jgi:hypothetical protein
MRTSQTLLVPPVLASKANHANKVFDTACFYKLLMNKDATKVRRPF